MEFLPENISIYSESHTSAESGLLYELNRQTHIRTTKSRMLSGHMQGRFLSFISKLSRPKFILEIGTFTGYSALCLAEGLAENGKLVTIDNNIETNAMARSYFQKSSFANQIELKEGIAQEIIRELDGPFDIVFIDADKNNYSAYFDLVIDKIPTGGLIIADNVLWSGKVVENLAKPDADTEAIKSFNAKIQADERVENMLLPIRDGLMVARKI
jgi:caffeoyl-CoA O-methyltransferase